MTHAVVVVVIVCILLGVISNLCVWSMVMELFAVLGAEACSDAVFQAVVVNCW